MAELPAHARLALFEQRAREVTVFSNRVPDAGHATRVRSRRLNGRMERQIVREIRDALEDSRDQDLCARLLNGWPNKVSREPPRVHSSQYPACM